MHHEGPQFLKLEVQRGGIAYHCQAEDGTALFAEVVVVEVKFDCFEEDCQNVG